MCFFLYSLSFQALNKLDQIDIQLKTTDLKPTSPQLAHLHAQLSKTIEEITAAPLAEGHAILDQAGRAASTEGVRRVVEQLENKKISLEGLCVAHKEENLRISRALNNFFEKQDELYSWLVNIAEAFLQSHRDMGSDSAMASDFLNLHNKLLTDLQVKCSAAKYVCNVIIIADERQRNQRSSTDPASNPRILRRQSEVRG